MPETIRIGVSACVLGEKIRCDGTHAYDPYVAEILAQHVEFVPLCPELACGMGLPREAVRQVCCGEEIRLIGQDSAEDWTERMEDWCAKILPSLEEDRLNGFIMAGDSPTCALRRSKIHSCTGKPPKHGPGFFTRRFMDAYPLLPVESATRLVNPILRENLLRRVFVHKRWMELLGKGMGIGRLVDFHTRHKMLIRAHDLKGYRELGRLLGESKASNVDSIYARYGELLFRSLALKATPSKNVDVLQHAMGYFKKDLDRADKQELLALIHAYKNGKVPLIVPVTVLNHHARKYDKPYLRQQYFLNPHPSELKLVNRP